MYTDTGIMLGEGRFGKVVEVIKDGILYVRKEYIEGEMSRENMANELYMMNQIKGCPYLIQIVDIEPNGDLVMERMDGTLLDLIREFQCIPEPILIDMTRHVLSGLAFLATKKIVHCDLKPENILYKKTDTSSGYMFVIGDFGNSSNNVMEQHYYIQTNEYRCIENVLGTTVLDTCCDIMSLGCILFECITSAYIVYAEKQETYKHVMNLLDAVGSTRLSQYDVSEIPELAEYISDVLTKDGISPLMPYYYKRYGYTEGESLTELIQSMIVPFPKQRIHVHDALAHPWLYRTLTMNYTNATNETTQEINYFYIDSYPYKETYEQKSATMYEELIRSNLDIFNRMNQMIQENPDLDNHINQDELPTSLRISHMIRNEWSNLMREWFRKSVDTKE